jgi:hypothetical protein
MLNSISIKTLLIGLVLLLMGTTPAHASTPVSIDFLMANTYSSGEPINIVILNGTRNPITIPESGNCHLFFSIRDSNGQSLALVEQNQVCTQEFRTTTLAPLESKTLGSWNQHYYVPCPPNAQCLVSSLLVQPGTYTIRVLIENQPYIEYPIIITGTSTTFSDVSTSHWAHQYIQNLYNKSIVQGYGNGKFGPDNGITRAEVLKMALKSANFKNPSSVEEQQTTDCAMEDLAADRCGSMIAPVLPYRDVPFTHSLYPYIYEAYSRGIIKSSTYFYPDQKATRIECLQYIVDAFGQSPAPLPANVPQAFSDVSSLQERAYTDSAAANGIVSGSEGKFFPTLSVTRAEISKMLANMID